MSVENFAEKLRERCEQAAANSQGDRMVFNPKDPLPIARKFAEIHYMDDITPTVHHYQDEFYSWNGAAYSELSTTTIRSEIYGMLENAQRFSGEEMRPFQPTAKRVSDVVDALKAVAHLRSHSATPLWLDGRENPPAHEILPCRNGLLHLPKGRLLPSTPLFFGMNAVDFDYQPDAPEPDAWTTFLDSLWPDDPEAIDTLQEMFGYLLTTDTSQQKAFLIIGPKRSGKGTLGRILKALIGTANVCAPTLSGLATNFGLQPLIGKPLAVISDARLSSRADQHVIAEHLLSVSGEDLQTIDRKHRAAWTGTLPTRFLILSNELPRISDSSGALASRFVVLTLTRSFYGCEDHALTGRLLAELPSILNWSIEGWKRLRDRGHFQQPESSKQAIEVLEELGSPVLTFIKDRCIVAPGQQVSPDKLFNEWSAWCEAESRDKPGTKQAFGRDLRTAVPGLKITQPRDEEGRQRRVYEGIGLSCPRN
jgi:putative DNA primase/helicase